MEQDKLATEESQHQPSEFQQGDSQDTQDNSEKSLDEIVEQEQKDIASLSDQGTEDEDQEEDAADSAEETEEDVAESDEEADAEGKVASAKGKKEYEPDTKYKVLDEEHEFDPKLKGFLTKETEPIIRELYEKAHGLDAIKASRATVTKERDELRTNYHGLAGEVGRVLNYKKAGDLDSFFESVGIPVDTLANYILEKARIAQLPPEQQAVYNEREQLRKRMNALEENVQSNQSTQNTQAVQARVAELDAVLGNDNIKSVAKAFEARNGQGSFKQAVMEHGAAKWYSTKKDMSAQEAVDSFIKYTGITVPKGQPKPGPDATKRVVARPKVKTIPNYGGSQASVTATQKPKSIEDLKRIRREKYGS